MKYCILVLALTAFWVTGCSRKQMEQSGRASEGSHPVKAATHVVELYKVQIGASDFGVSRFGNPLDIRVVLLEDGREIAANEATTLSGVRGKRTLEYPIAWTVNFDPKKRYQLQVQEQAVDTEAHTWSFPSAPRAGYWPFPDADSRITVGTESYLQFRDKIED
jgi:hypothetical protein